jgi:ribosomal protein S1
MTILTHKPSRLGPSPSLTLPPSSPNPPPTDTSSIDFSYEEFSSSVESTLVSFNRNDVITGSVVQYENGGALVDIGAKASAFLPLAEAGLALTEEKGAIESMVALDAPRQFQIISEEVRGAESERTGSPSPPS